ncbi:MAG: DNA mismatch repair protein MutS [Defluviitaleaceae bacterium]|nr:DNA mismatch repair protein MutS [Defluviitaleaceae bacterium]
MRYSPMMRQYLEIKDKHKDRVLFFRLGDFYELFFGDAQIGADVLGLTLTSRESGDGKILMCGMPHHAAIEYIEKLVQAGYDVAVCEQTDEEKDGIMRREVVQIYTAGTMFLQNDKCNYVMSICLYNKAFGVSYCDVSTGEFYTTSIKNFENLVDEILKVSPNEIITCPDFANGFDIESIIKIKPKTIQSWEFLAHKANKRLCGHFNVASLSVFGVVPKAAVLAAGGLLEYLKYTQLNSLLHINRITPYNNDAFMALDKYTRRNLELFENLADRELKGSLLWVLDETQTAMGGRLLHKWLSQPLMNIDEIKSRQEAIREYKEHSGWLESVRSNLKNIADLERFCAKIVYKRVNGRDLLALQKSLSAIRDLFMGEKPIKSSLNRYLFEEADALDDIFNLIDGKILDNVSNAIDEGGIFAYGYNAELDTAKVRQNQLYGQLAQYEAKLKEELNIKGLKVGQNKVFGYYIEVPNSQKARVSADFISRQTLANAQRYSSETLKQIEIDILTATESVINLECALFMVLRNEIVKKVPCIQQTAHMLAHIDVLQALGKIANDYNYIQPNVTNGGIIEIHDSRHPVIERIFEGFVPNNVYLNDTDSKIAIITGPNMAGKSTFMRQVALCVVMAQMGSFIPATAANIAVCDAVYTRVGAADDLSRGQSTFMVEMSEVAYILGNATASSLVLLDEVGRGTGTTDGLAIAMATIEHIDEKIGAKTLFATHYHELVAAESKIESVYNLSMEIDKDGDSIKFLWKVVMGGTNNSHGIYVAKMAGLPSELVERSQQIHTKLAMRGAFDDDAFDIERVPEYAAVKEQVKRYRLFLEELGAMQIENVEIKRVLDDMRKV